MIAALPMYDWPEERAAVDALWGAIRDSLRARGLAAPETLTRGAPLWDIWHAPDLVVGQTCGLPYRSRLHGKVHLIGSLDFALPDAPPGYYYSHMIARRADPRRNITDFDRAMLAINGFDSQSGWAAAAEVAAKARLTFRDFHHSGAHQESAVAVANGHAGIAAIDAVTWRLIERHRPELAGKLRIVVSSAPTPGLPLIAAPDQDAETIFAAISTALATMPTGLRRRLGIAGLARIDATEYLAIPTPPIPNQGAPVM